MLITDSRNSGRDIVYIILTPYNGFGVRMSRTNLPVTWAIFSSFMKQTGMHGEEKETPGRKFLSACRREP